MTTFLLGPDSSHSKKSLDKQCRPRSGCFQKSSLISVYIICSSTCIIFRHYFMVEPVSFHFRMFSGVSLDVRILSYCTVVIFAFFRPFPGMRESGLDKQNVMRLRINRIALVQELRVEHVLRYLTESGILTEDDLRRITNGSTPGDKARVLVDILTCEYYQYSQGRNCMYAKRHVRTTWWQTSIVESLFYRRETLYNCLLPAALPLDPFYLSFLNLTLP